MKTKEKIKYIKIRMAEIVCCNPNLTFEEARLIAEEELKNERRQKEIN